MSRKKPHTPSKHRQGRPDKLNEQTQRMLIDCIVAGTPIMKACQAAGVSYRAHRDWYVQGENGEPKYQKYYEAIVQAEGQFVATCMATIMTAAKTSWQAAAWALERRHPNEFAVRREITGAGGGPVQLTGHDKLVKALDAITSKQTGNATG